MVTGVTDSATPYTIPAAETVAIALSELLHVPPLPPSVSIIVPGKHSTDDGPVILVVAPL